MELSDEGAALLALACAVMQGQDPADAMPVEQCRFVNVDFLASYWLVRTPMRRPLWPVGDVPSHASRTHARGAVSLF